MIPDWTNYDKSSLKNNAFMAKHRSCHAATGETMTKAIIINGKSIAEAYLNYQ
jgi:hypothetical protein